MKSQVATCTPVMANKALPWPEQNVHAEQTMFWTYRWFVVWNLPGCNKIQKDTDPESPLPISKGWK